MIDGQLQIQLSMVGIDMINPILLRELAAKYLDNSWIRIPCKKHYIIYPHYIPIKRLCCGTDAVGSWYVDVGMICRHVSI